MAAGVFILFLITFAATISTERIRSPSCDPFTGEGCNSPCRRSCGCDNELIFDEKTGGCVMNTVYLDQLTGSPDNYEAFKHEIALQHDEVASKRDEIEANIKSDRKFGEVFRWIFIAVGLVVLCTGIGISIFYIHCCRIFLTRGILRRDVIVVLERKGNQELAPLTRDPNAKSCHV